MAISITFANTWKGLRIFHREALVPLSLAIRLLRQKSPQGIGICPRKLRLGEEKDQKWNDRQPEEELVSQENISHTFNLSDHFAEESGAEAMMGG